MIYRFFARLLACDKSSITPQCVVCVWFSDGENDGDYAESRQVLVNAAEEKLAVNLWCGGKCKRAHLQTDQCQV